MPLLERSSYSDERCVGYWERRGEAYFIMAEMVVGKKKRSVDDRLQARADVRTDHGQGLPNRGISDSDPHRADSRAFFARGWWSSRLPCAYIQLYVGKHTLGS